MPNRVKFEADVHRAIEKFHSSPWGHTRGNEEHLSDLLKQMVYAYANVWRDEQYYGAAGRPKDEPARYPDYRVGV